MHSRTKGRDKLSNSYKGAQSTTSDADKKRKIHKIKSKIDDIKDREKYYSQHPEEHELYKKQWTEYWVHRCKELKKEGKDPANHDFRKEWSNHWRAYIKEYYGRKIADLEAEIKALNKIPEYDSISSSSEDEFGRNKQKRLKADVYEAPVSLISILRVLSALEEELGSLLSSKVIDLLAKALEVERVKPNASDEILKDGESYLFLATASEKLKGLISIKMLESRKASVAQKCVDDISQLLQQFPVPKTLTERQKIADMIEKEVAAHGKTDLTPLELDVLVDVYLEGKQAQEIKTECEDEKVNPHVEINFSDAELIHFYNGFEGLDDNYKQLVMKEFKNIEMNDPERNKRLQKLIFNQNPSPQKTTTVPSDDDDDANYNIHEIFHSILNAEQL